MSFPTPCLILNVDVMRRNLRTMQEKASAKGKALRPHAKTHKCSRIAREQLEAGAIGICAAKVSEAERLADAGITGVLVTSPLSTADKADRLMAFTTEATDPAVVVECAEGARLLEDAAARRGVVLSVLLDLDVGLDRTGVAPEAAVQLAAAMARDCPHLRLCGVQAYAGHLQHIANAAERREQSLTALKTAADVFRVLASEFPQCRILSTSGTGTAEFDMEIPEVTELQVGSYALMDVEYGELESPGDGELLDRWPAAMRLRSSVISVRDGFVTIDAGLKAIYQDGPPPRPLAPYGHLRYRVTGDEHGRLDPAGEGSLPRLGETVDLLVSHCDPTVNLFSRYILETSGMAGEAWPIDLRGCVQ